MARNPYEGIVTEFPRRRMWWRNLIAAAVLVVASISIFALILRLALALLLLDRAIKGA